MSKKIMPQAEPIFYLEDDVISFHINTLKRHPKLNEFLFETMEDILQFCENVTKVINSTKSVIEKRTDVLLNTAREVEALTFSNLGSLLYEMIYDKNMKRFHFEHYIFEPLNFNPYDDENEQDEIKDHNDFHKRAQINNDVFYFLIDIEKRYPELNIVIRNFVGEIYTFMTQIKNIIEADISNYQQYLKLTELDYTDLLEYNNLGLQMLEAVLGDHKINW